MLIDIVSANIPLFGKIYHEKIVGTMDVTTGAMKIKHAKFCYHKLIEQFNILLELIICQNSEAG